MSGSGVDPDILSATAELEFPYQHSTGPVIGKFLTALRDEGRLYGIECRACALVLVPPQDYCEVCGGALSISAAPPVSAPLPGPAPAAPAPTSPSASSWREVGPEGVLTTFAVVRRSQAIHPRPVPFAYALIRLDGAGTDLLHFVCAADYAALHAGLRVRPIWKEERRGSILDISHFEPVVNPR
jgi:hypothetical protein